MFRRFPRFRVRVVWRNLSLEVWFRWYNKYPFITEVTDIVHFFTVGSRFEVNEKKR